MEKDMDATFDIRLTAFNRQVAQRQEEAYTLAYYLLGSADAATQAVQSAFIQAFRQTTVTPDRLRLLRLVINSVKSYLLASPSKPNDPLAARFLALPEEERRAILLVDVLGLNYTEAAQVLGTNTARVSQWLARGRMLAMPA